jgi:hypothetical protein
MDIIWTQEQVDKLNAYQNDNIVHPCTCNANSSNCFRKKAYELREKGQHVEYNNENEGVLIATTQGWVCSCGNYKQTWKHENT